MNKIYDFSTESKCNRMFGADSHLPWNYEEKYVEIIRRSEKCSESKLEYF